MVTPRYLAVLLCTTIACAQSIEFATDGAAVELPLVILGTGNYPGLPCVEVAMGP